MCLSTVPAGSPSWTHRPRRTESVAAGWRGGNVPRTSDLISVPMNRERSTNNSICNVFVGEVLLHFSHSDCCTDQLRVVDHDITDTRLELVGSAGG